MSKFALAAEAAANRERAERLKVNDEALAGYDRPRPRQAADLNGEPIVVREAWKRLIGCRAPNHS